MGTTRWTLSPNTALIVQFSVQATQIEERTSHRVERKKCLQTLLWTSRESFSALRVCLQCSGDSLWRTASLLRVGEPLAHQSLPSPFTVRCGSPSKLTKTKKKTPDEDCLFTAYVKIIRVRERETDRERKKVAPSCVRSLRRISVRAQRSPRQTWAGL